MEKAAERGGLDQLGAFSTLSFIVTRAGKVKVLGGAIQFSKGRVVSSSDAHSEGWGSTATGLNCGTGAALEVYAFRLMVQLPLEVHPADEARIAPSGWNPLGCIRSVSLPQ